MGGAPVTVTFNGKQLIRVPEIGLRVVPGVNLLDNRLRLEAPIEYYSKRYADTANTQSLPAYTVVNLNARWDVTDALSFSLAGVNLTNEIGLTEGNPRAGQFISGDAGAKYYLARPVLGRSWRVAASHSNSTRPGSATPIKPLLRTPSAQATKPHRASPGAGGVARGSVR